jgi:hypothetical protein
VRGHHGATMGLLIMSKELETDPIRIHGHDQDGHCERDQVAVINILFHGRQ